MNPKLSSKIWIPVLLLVMAYGFYMQGSPGRSLKACREWINQHDGDWQRLKEVNSALKHVELNVSTQSQGSIVAFGYTYDHNAIVEVNRFVEVNAPPKGKFKNMIKLISKTTYDFLEEDK